MVDFKRCPGNSPFCLGLTEYNCCGSLEKEGGMLRKKRQNLGQKASNSDIEEIDDNDFETKKQKLSLCKEKEKKRHQILHPSSRFNVTITESEVKKSLKGCIPVNTAKCTSWAMRVFQDWVVQRNKRTAEIIPSTFSISLTQYR